MTDNARNQAKAQLESIIELVDAAHNNPDSDVVLDALATDPLEVVVRGAWRESHSAVDDEPVDYRILLCTGGPAVCIRGDLENGSPVTAVLLYQDWGIPWTRYPTDEQESQYLLDYAGYFLG